MPSIDLDFKKISCGKYLQGICKLMARVYKTRIEKGINTACCTRLRES